MTFPKHSIFLLGENLEDIGEILHHLDHDYLMESVDEFAVNYVAGFVARHSRKYVKDCQECAQCLKKPETEKTDLDLLITLKSKGYLTYPSEKLVDTIRVLETQVVSTAVNNELDENILFTVLDNMENVKVSKIGCPLHDHELTKSIMKFYLITRMHMLVKRWNAKNVEVRKAQKGHRKQANLT